MIRIFCRSYCKSSPLNTVSWTHLIPKNKAYVAGEWITASSGKTFPVLNPANRTELCHVPAMSSDEVHMAIQSAKVAQSSWSRRPAESRAAIIRDWARAIEENRDALAQLITAENGKTLSDSYAEVSSGVASLYWYAEEAKRIYGKVVPSLDVSNRRQLIHYRPVGVVGIVTPWNFPLSMITRKAGAALAAGCAVILKPAEDTPLSALAITHLAVSNAKLPAGLLNTITASRDPEGAQAIGEVLCKDPLVRLIGFTGSTSVGKRLYSQASVHGKRVLLELGGNAPFVVFSSANLDRAVKGMIASKFRCSGQVIVLPISFGYCPCCFLPSKTQTCVSANRILVEDCIYDEFVERTVAAVQQLKMGDGSEQNTRIGPLINEAAVNKVNMLVESAKEAGAKALVGGSLPTGEPFNRGCFYPPTVLADCSASMNCVRNEIFGPVAPICRFKTETEAIEMANGTAYGLAAYVYTNDIRQAWHFSEQVAFGMVGLNSPRVSSSEMPFGGIKDSGIGREGGPDALYEFMDLKTINWDLI
ncbi:Aldehyde dehydrogenase NAD(P)+ protein [Fasciola hepatica]|uniref:Aldehyde dehydrogenase NAD(P)+ protein n=1 Tax=Fasciola hepatica TaxID=6192 RepID=A0A4E0RYX8_FASHE|nr:Aldehyde dehydrogenase NAD(P)+ protein [Fasciola hepatica]